jgi:rubrerythrin
MAFDIDGFTRTSERVGYEDLDLDIFLDNPLPPRTLRTIRYMADVEYHTVCYLRDMLVTPSHAEGDVSAFMTFWNREEFWHGEALSAVLARHDITLDFDQLKAKRLKLGWKDRLSPVVQSLGSNLIGKDFIAVHMAWGAANEWSAGEAYRRLAAIEDEPVLTTLLQRIAKQESRHVAFYATQARKRLEGYPKAQKIARFALTRFWGPVGTGVMPETEVDHVMHHLFSGPEGRSYAARIDSNISRLPGLDGLRIVQDALDRRGVPA